MVRAYVYGVLQEMGDRTEKMLQRLHPLGARMALLALLLYATLGSCWDPGAPMPGRWNTVVVVGH